MSLNVFAHSGLPKDYSSFKCVASALGQTNEYNIHSCDYKKNTCMIALHTEYDLEELNVKVHAKLWAANLTILYNFERWLRILTIYPDNGGSGTMPLSLIWQTSDPPVRHQFDENHIVGGAKHFVGTCMPID